MRTLDLRQRVVVLGLAAPGFFLHCTVETGVDPDSGGMLPGDATGGESPLAVGASPGNESGGVGAGASTGGMLSSGPGGGAGTGRAGPGNGGGNSGGTASGGLPSAGTGGASGGTGGASQNTGGSAEDPATSDPTCATGILADGACCAASCGACGGTGCGSLEGGSSACCRGPIIDAGVSCSDSLPPCVLEGATPPPPPPPPPSGDFLVHATFETQSLGTYARSDVNADFGSTPSWDNGLGQGRATIVDEGNNRFLRVTYPANQYGPGNGGVQFEVDLSDSYDELYLSYRVRFASNFNFMKGGKLPGLVGGSSPSGCTTDKTGGFSARNMWRTGGDVDQYLYYPDRQNNCGDDWYYTLSGNHVKFHGGQWHTIEHRLVMGTAGQSNGVMQAWFDGQLALDRSIRWKVAGATYGIDALYFSTFFGGGDSSWAPPTSQQADFDDFIVSTTPITH